jgi:hypothetical protein
MSTLCTSGQNVNNVNTMPMWLKGDPDEPEHRFNSETYTLSAGAVGMMLHRNGNFTM